MNEPSKKFTVLAVDDTPENLDVVRGILAQDYVVKVAINGPMALKIVEKQKPDLILLDVMMPEMDGHEVCRRLKANPDSAAIPVIFLTAMDQTMDEALGFSLGAADYIAKPVNPPILQARVSTHLALKESMDELQKAYRIIKSQKDRMEEELNIGREIQMSMLPLEFPAFPDRDEFRVHALLEPAREVGGDFYDFFFVNPDEICLVVGDVSGKGVPAALFMAVTKTMIKTRAMDDPSPASIVTRVNDEMSEDNPSSMFITLFIAICNVRTGECRYTNAGHNPPYVLRGTGGLDCLNDRHGPIIGAMEGLAYREGQLRLNAADRLVVFTDGVTEAMDPGENLYSERRLESFLAGSGFPSIEELNGGIITSVEEFASGAEQADDITLLSFSLEKEPDRSELQATEIVIAAELSEIDRLNADLARFAKQHGAPAGHISKLNIAIDELINNIVNYGLKDGDDSDIRVRCSFGDDRLMVQIIDGAKPFNPFASLRADTTSSIDERQMGGLGRLLVVELMDHVDYERRRDKNVVTLTMDIAQ
jgi:sigma-B regulation protein RsbU (phosphoserine phosphatase)